MSGDIFAGQPTDADLLAELYDLEHDEVVEDLVFYREQTRRSGPAVLDLGCGSGRLLRSFAAGKGRRIVGVDGSGALLRRAEARIAAEPLLAAARGQGRLHLVEGDVRRLGHLPLRGMLGPAGANLVVAAGVIPHLDGPEDALRMLAGVELAAGAGGQAHPRRPGAGAAAGSGPAAVGRLAAPDERPGGRSAQPIDASRGPRRAARGLLDDRRRRTTRWYDSAVSGQPSTLVSIA